MRRSRLPIACEARLSSVLGSATDEVDALLAHELNQPLTALILYLRAMERLSLRPSVTPALPLSVIAILEKALHEAERASNIIQRMRRFSEKREPFRQLVDLNLLIDDAVELTLLGTRPGTRVMRKLAAHLPPVSVDPVQIQQIVVNLVRNALEAMKDHSRPKVHIRTRQQVNSVVLEIEDSGPGIPQEAMPSLFQAFSSSKGNGLGLGLIISRALARKHGGELTADPGGNGRGAIFTLHLPVPSPVAAPPLVACGRYVASRGKSADGSEIDVARRNFRRRR